MEIVQLVGTLCRGEPPIKVVLRARGILGTDHSMLGPSLPVSEQPEEEPAASAVSVSRRQGPDFSYRDDFASEFQQHRKLETGLWRRARLHLVSQGCRILPQPGIR